MVLLVLVLQQNRIKVKISPSSFIRAGENFLGRQG
jgi:hypothetical protein